MSHRSGARVRSWVAIFAAYLLVVQALLAGFAAGAHANALSFDRTLALAHCAPDDTAPSGGDHDKSQNHAGMGCCTAGCPMLVGADPGQPGSQLLVHRPVDLVAFARRLDRPVGFLSDHSPGNPRAPPARA
ncbi:hypothetical protein [Bosea minatitlanensis]|uniref:DUF2946 domain-containing protein n=1 Tax=Bosea minatitlanensis TaxID=128782 RepID=A0ABW0F1L9_9HYPH|nr:hypothetical protein [Bosea minatitlanensis]MCT4491716.1 hypothetical protein [Bosea minatitlanensis]